MDKIIVATIGTGLVGFIYWFFFGKKDDFSVAGDTVNITVDGGYNPKNIKIKNGKSTKLIFTRRDSNSCLEDVIIPEFKIKEYLPLNKKVEINITPKNVGTYEIHCGMNMFHGKIIVY